MKYNARFFKPGDERQIVSLLEEVWNGWPKFDLQCAPMGHWRWKYQNTPKETSITLAELEGNLIGCLHVMTSRIKVGEHLVQGCQGTDLVVHPDYRRMGVYNSINELFDKLTLNISISGNPIVYRRAISRGSTPFPRSLIPLVRIVDINKHLELKERKNVLLKKIGYKTLSFFQDASKGSRIEDEIPSDAYEISGVEKFSPSIDVFWDKIKDHYEFIIIRDREYLNWRYCDSRGGDYKVFIITKGEEITGYSVLRVNKYDVDYHIGNIVDMMTLPGEETSLKMLFNHALNFFDEREINIVHFLCVKDSLLMKTALKFGFKKVQKKILLWFSHKNTFKNGFLERCACK